MEKLVSGAERLGFPLNEKQVESFKIYYRELIAWNQRVNLTAIVDYEDVQARHFLDSLTVALAFPHPASFSGQMLDVGTGAGMPGVPLKILWPEAKLVLLDSVAKKTAFLSHLVSQLELEGVEVVRGRAEDLARDPNYRDRFDLVLSRAMAPLPGLTELTLPFCRVGGTLVAQKKGGVGMEIDKAAKAIALLGGQLRGVKWVDLEGTGDRRALVIIDKVATTPQIYPRRAGVPVRRPLKA